MEEPKGIKMPAVFSQSLAVFNGLLLLLEYTSSRHFLLVQGSFLCVDHLLWPIIFHHYEFCFTFSRETASAIAQLSDADPCKFILYKKKKKKTLLLKFLEPSILTVRVSCVGIMEASLLTTSQKYFYRLLSLKITFP